MEQTSSNDERNVRSILDSCDETLEALTEDFPDMPELSDILNTRESGRVEKIVAAEQRRLTRKSIIGQYTDHLSSQDVVRLCYELFEEAMVHPRYKECGATRVVMNMRLLDKDEETYSKQRVVPAIDAMIRRYKPSRALKKS